jgi:hyperosmotically inducible protein
MRIHLITVLGAALLVGCADRDNTTTTTRRTTTPSTQPAPSTTTPRTTADRTTPGQSGAVSNEGRVETRTETQTERTAARPIIEDPNADREPDNTGVNKRDADTDLTKTPADQGQNRSDVDTTAAIRKRVVDMDLSTNAENAKIITENGNVTLRGVVESDEEKQTLERIAREIAGKGKVTNELEVDKD